MTMSQTRTVKQQRSEERRLLAIEQTRNAMNKKSSCSISTCQRTHIVFESDSDEHEDISRQCGQVEEKAVAPETTALTGKKLNGAYTKKITGKVADQWLGFDSDDEQNSSTSSLEGRADVVIPFRPQFEGKRGEKLMRLQQQVGQDKRFEVSRAFLDESSSDDSNVDIQGDVEEDFEREKAMSLAVLQSIVGSKVAIQRNKEVSKKREISIQRYDPADNKCADLEVKHKGRDETRDLVQTVKKSDKVSTTGEHPVVSEERFYSVGSDLNFSGGQGAHSFSFLEMLGRADEEMQSTAAEQTAVEEDTKKLKKRQAKKRLVTHLDSSSDEESGVMEDQQTLQTDEENTDDDNGFFFLFDDSGSFRGRLADGVKRFMRTQSMEEIETKWKLDRRALTQEYKKKRKDALRRIKKSKFYHSVSKA